MKKLSLVTAWAMFGLAFLSAPAISKAADEKKEAAVWLTDYAKAQATAKEQKKVVMLDFTGSDWCPPCMALKKTVFTSAEFTKFAGEKLVLVEVDFPEKKKLPEAQQKANDDLATKFKVESYPTVILVDNNGKELLRMDGYDGSSGKDFVAKLAKKVPKK
jgi:thioredoxin-related protein